VIDQISVEAHPPGQQEVSMSDVTTLSVDLGVDLGQPVHLRTDPSGKVGYVVAVMLTPPHQALVRWRGTEATFEALDDLVEVAPRIG
jgi:hypothetical protein